MKTFKTERPVNSAAISPIKPHVSIIRVFFLNISFRDEFFSTLCILLLRATAHLTRELHCNHATFAQGAGQGYCDVLKFTASYHSLLWSSTSTKNNNLDMQSSNEENYICCFVFYFTCLVFLVKRVVKHFAGRNFSGGAWRRSGGYGCHDHINSCRKI